MRPYIPLTGGARRDLNYQPPGSQPGILTPIYPLQSVTIIEISRRREPAIRLRFRIRQVFSQLQISANLGNWKADLIPFVFDFMVQFNRRISANTLRYTTNLLSAVAP